MAAWRIDTLDARGGLAFATPQVDSDNESPLFFIGAPDFSPQPITNRSIAHAAARGVFQIGLFTQNSEEILFPQLSDVAEFVRRTYTRSGGGDGSDGGGENLPPVLPDIPWEGLGTLRQHHEFKNDEKSLRADISSALESFIYKAKNHDVGWAEEFTSWPSLSAQESRQQVFGDGPDMLTAAALRLIGEMIIRMPSLSKTREFARWSRSAKPLGAFISRLGLWPSFLSYRQTLKSLGSILYRILQISPYFDIQDPKDMDEDESFMFAFVVINALIGGGIANFSNIREFFHILSRRRYFPFPWLGWHGGDINGLRDPISALRLIPVPKNIAQACCVDTNQEFSLFHLLSAVIGSPATIINHQDDIFDLLLFASACITNVGGVQNPFAEGWDHGSYIHIPTDHLQREAVGLVVNDAWAWLREHLPKVVYSKQVEDIISRSAKLRYPVEKHEEYYK